MRILLLLAVISCAFQVQAFTYSETEAFDKPSPFELALFTQDMKRAEFHPLDQEGSGLIPFLNMDQVYALGEKTVFLKLGMKISDAGLLGKIITHPKGFIFHSVTAKKTPYALFFYQMTFSEAQNVLIKTGQVQIAGHDKTDLFSKFALFYQLANLEARAESPNYCLAEANELKKTEQNLSGVGGNVLGDILKSCAISAVKGVVDGVKDTVENAWYVTKTLFTNPEKLWDDVVKTYDQIKDFVLNFKTKMTEFFAAMKALDPMIAGEVACSMIASVVVKSMLKGGVAGLATAGVLVAGKISALGKIKNALQMISKVQKKMPGSNRPKDLARDMVACAR